MSPRLNPALPVLWRSAHAFQIGFDRSAVIVDRVTPALEYLLGALRAGASRDLLYGLGTRHGLSPAAVTEFLQRLSPVLESSIPGPEPVDPVAFRWVLDGEGVRARSLLGLAHAAGMPPAAAGSAAAEQPDLVVLLGDFVIPARRYSPWLARDIPHLAVTYMEKTIRIGPLVEPGSGPCLGCDARYRHARDPAWSALATQVYDLVAASRNGPLATTAAALSLAAISARLAHDDRELERAQILLDGTTLAGRRSTLIPHPECGCRAGKP